jgi:hypothetical protein
MNTFLERFTMWDAEVRRSCSHQRIVQYDFGSLQFLLRTEADAYVRDAATPSISGSSSNKGPQFQTPLPDVFNMIPIDNIHPSFDGELPINLQGRKISQESIFDIKTRSDFNVFDTNEILYKL